MLELALLQPGPPQMTVDALRFTVTAGLFVIIMVVVLYFIFRSMRKATDSGVKAQIETEFEKSKDALLLAAAAKSQRKELDSARSREAEIELKERELLRENVDPALVIGRVDPLSGLTIEEDMELVIDPYTGEGYLLPSFLNDWPAGQERPKFVYRHPQGTVVKSSDLVRLM